MSYIKTNWVNDTTELNTQNMNHIEDGVEKAYGQLLLAVDSVAPEECVEGDKYYNTETNKIYTATGTNTWGTTGEDAELGVFYIVLETQNIYTYNGETLISVGGGAGGGADLPIGTVEVYAGSTTPDGYLFCDGSAVSRITYSDLFSVIGTTYGTGDGSTTFNLPNIKGRVVVMLDSTQTEFDTLGETGGSKYLQAHAHQSVWGSSSASGDTTSHIYDNVGFVANGNPASGSANYNTSQSGTGNSGNLQPYIVLNYIIKATKITPIQAQVVNVANNSTTDTYSCDYINDCINYSTSETFTGKYWENGKPIYKKVLTGTTPSTSNTLLYSATNIEEIVNSYGWVQTQASTTKKIPVNSYSNDGEYNNISLTVGTGIYFNGSYVLGKPYKIVIEYTKTTD